MDPKVWKTGEKRKRSRLRKLAGRYAGYYLIRVFHAIVCRLPRPAGRALAWVVGTNAYLLLRRERGIAIQNLTHAYGAERTPAEIRRITRGVFRHAASVIIDWAILSRWSPERLRKQFPEVVAALRKHPEAVKPDGTGIVTITGHCGNWEVHSLLYGVSTPGFLIPVAKRLYFKKYDDFFQRLRMRNGVQIIYSDESARKMIRTLKEGKSVAFLADQDLRTNSGVFVSFFGRPAYTVTFPVSLARKVGASIAFTILAREGNGFRVVHREVSVPETGDEEADVLAATQLWTTMLEEEIRKRPEQWSWIHPRWRTTLDKPRRQRDKLAPKRKED